jgi:uncharacterized protein (TIGR00270 family)
MPSCDLCGAPSVGQAKVEGTILSVCKNCQRFGQPLHPKPLSNYHQPVKVETSSRLLVENAALLVRHAREARGLSHVQLALAIKEKESVIQHIEAGSLRPSETLARKLEQFLKIQIYKNADKEDSLLPKTTPSTGLTIGDLMKK